MDYYDILKDTEELLNNVCKEDIGRMKYHVIPVVTYAKELALEFGADIQVVELAAYFHDLTKIMGDKDNHHITSAEYAKNFLKERNLEDEKIEKIYNCILNHRGSIISERETIEEKIVATADSMAHIINALPMFYKWYGIRQLSIEDGAKKIREKLERSWKKVEIAEVRERLKDKFEFLMEVVTNGEK